MNKADILNAVDYDFNDEGVHYGESPQQKLISRLGLDPAQAATVAGYYQWANRGQWKQPRPPVRTSVVERHLTDYAGEDDVEAVRRTIEDYQARCSSAQHEAGHATVAKYVNAKIRSVSVNRTGGGYMEYVPSKNTDAEIKILLAGAIGADLGHFNTYGTSSDKEMLIETVRAEFEKFKKTHLTTAEYTDQQLLDFALAQWPEVERIVDEHRPFFNALTKHLIGKGELTGAEVDELWNQFTPR